jgi:hypothetical protein
MVIIGEREIDKEMSNIAVESDFYIHRLFKTQFDIMWECTETKNDDTLINGTKRN